MEVDYYTEWLGAPPGDRPPNHYVLLGLDVFCRDLQAIETATRRQLACLDKFTLQPDRETRDLVQNMMNEVARARVDLANPERRAEYDRGLARELGVDEPPEIPVGAQSAEQTASPLQPRMRLEPESPLTIDSRKSQGKVHREPKGVTSPAVRFEAIVWAHLRKWRLNPHERRLLLVEAFLMGIPAKEALAIILRMDDEAEVVADVKYKRNAGGVVKVLVGLVAVLILAVVIYLAVSPQLSGLWSTDDSEALARERLAEEKRQASVRAAKRKEQEELFTDILSRARSLSGGGLLDQARGELSKARAIFPDDPRLRTALRNLTAKLRSREKRLTGVLTRVNQFIDRSDLNRAETELGKARDISPDDPRLKQAAGRLTTRRAAEKKAFLDTLARVRTLIDRGALEKAREELARIDRVFRVSPKYVQLRDEAVEKLGKQEAKLMQLASTMRASLTARDLPAATKALSQADAIRPGDSRFARMRKTLATMTAAAGKAPKVATLTGHASHVCSVAFSPDGKLLVSGGSDNTVKIWDVATRCPLGSLSGHTGSVRSVAFSPDGKRIASASYDKTVRVWDVATGRKISILRGHDDQVNSVVFSSDGKRITAGSWAVVKTWEASSGRDLASFRAHKSAVWSVAFSPDGKRFASASRDKTVKIWSSNSKLGFKTLTGHTNWVYSAAFSPDSRRVVSGSYDKTVKIWNAVSGREIRTLKGHKSYVYSVAFSPDGKRIASGSWDKTVKIWDAVSGREIVTLEGHASPVNSLAFSPDGELLASASNDKTIKLWNLFSWTNSLK
ncbi:MAG: hypothetical protein QGG42_16845 [Phycisphaerae bacterium]|nr:hypothetical protein [Phycisphaerae bacterium]